MLISYGEIIGEVLGVHGRQSPASSTFYILAAHVVHSYHDMRQANLTEDKPPRTWSRLKAVKEDPLESIGLLSKGDER